MFCYMLVDNICENLDLKVEKYFVCLLFFSFCVCLFVFFFGGGQHFLEIINPWLSIYNDNLWNFASLYE